MNQQTELNKTELMKQIDRSWTALQAALGRLSISQLSAVKDAAGWAVKDHVMHMAAWERSVLFLLNGRPRHAGLDVSETLYLNSSEEAINAAIFERSVALPAEEALAQLREVHVQTLVLLRRISDADLHQPQGDYLADEVGAGEGPLLIDVVYANTAEHFTEHLAWIEALAKGENDT